MKHVAIDARDSGTSTGRYVDKLIEYLHRLEPTYRITILTKPHRLDYMASIAPTFQRQACPHKEFTFDEQIGFKRQLDKLQPDLIHFAAVQQPVWYRGRVVTTMHDLTTLRFRNPAKNLFIFTFKQLVYRWVNLRVARKSALLLTPTQFVKDDIIRFSGIDPSKITVTLEAADDLPMPAEPVYQLSNKRFIMYVGRPTPHKNLERLIQAFAKLQANHPDLYLAFVGKQDANYRDIVSQVKQQGVERVVFTDFISEQQLRWTYEHCQAYVFPSLSEGFGLPGLEAMRHGAPVLSSNATCLPEVYGDAALYFDPLDVDDIAGKIAGLLANEDLRQQTIHKGYTQAAKYSWLHMAEQTLAVYGQALSVKD